MHKFNTADNQRFWESYRSSYQGGSNAEHIVFLGRNYIQGSVLDVGAGDGSLLTVLKRRHPKATVSGIDLAPKREDIEQGDITQMLYQNDEFDTVFCTEVIEHLTPEDTDLTLSEINRVLKPGGSAIITTPYAEDLAENTVCCLGCSLTFHRWGHQQSFTEPDFNKLASRHQFEVESVFPLKFSRIRKLRWLGSRVILKSAWLHSSMRRASGKRHLFMIARKSSKD